MTSKRKRILQATGYATLWTGLIILISYGLYGVVQITEDLFGVWAFPVTMTTYAFVVIWGVCMKLSRGQDHDQ